MSSHASVKAAICCVMHPILHEIRKQLRLIHEPSRDGSAAAERWAAEQWWEAFVFTFYYGPKNGFQPESDDLLFLVLDAGFRGATDSPYTVIRRLEELPTEFHKTGSQFGKIDWRQTLELNFVMQTTYTITVAICTAEEVPLIGVPAPLPNPMSIKVAKSVHASTIRVGLDLKHDKADEASVCYPDICFAVEDYEDAFSSFVLTDESQLFSVMLSTTRLTPPSAQPPPVATEVPEIQVEEDGVMYDPLMHPRQPPASTSTETEERVTWGTQHHIFGGWVSFVQVKRCLLGKTQCMPHRILQERVIPMRGPGGQGLAEVFASIDAGPSVLPVSSHATSEDESEAAWPNRPRSFLQRSFRSARDLLRRLGRESDMAEIDITDESKLKFRCSLMTLTLPVSIVALKILES